MVSRCGRLDIDHLELALRDTGSFIASVPAQDWADLCARTVERLLVRAALRSNSSSVRDPIPCSATAFLVLLLRRMRETARDLVRSWATRLFWVGESRGHLVATHPQVTRGPTGGRLILDISKPARSALRVDNFVSRSRTTAGVTRAPHLPFGGGRRHPMSSHCAAAYPRCVHGTVGLPAAQCNSAVCTSRPARCTQYREPSISVPSGDGADRCDTARAGSQQLPLASRASCQ